MPYKDYKREEVSELGRAIYKEKIKDLVEPMENGKFITIDIESGDYETGERLIDTSDRLHDRRPNAVCYIGRVGYPNAFRMGWRGTVSLASNGGLRRSRGQS